MLKRRSGNKGEEHESVTEGIVQGGDGWRQEAQRDGEAEKNKGCCFSVTFHKLMVLISPIEKFNCHMSLIRMKTGG
ncbi:unnamed protein product [Trifolium pratense]|uniref:Uncharacterized protein n=1 Tax=Trifolium pratense TaxID=57577 RepID=A0ACB0ISQ5_TRIPR|nr:unnamed protein product [Trifolium pratense]